MRENEKKTLAEWRTRVWALNVRTHSTRRKQNSIENNAKHTTRVAALPGRIQLAILLGLQIAIK